MHIACYVAMSYIAYAQTKRLNSKIHPREIQIEHQINVIN